MAWINSKDPAAAQASIPINFEDLNRGHPILDAYLFFRDNPKFIPMICFTPVDLYPVWFHQAHNYFLLHFSFLYQNP